MQAAVYKPGSPTLHIVNDFPIPKPGPHEVLIRVKACGVCHSDIAFLSLIPEDPRTYIMGHEVSGIATELGSKVDKEKVKEGQLYSILALGGCAKCLKLPNTSTPLGITSVDSIGVGANGGYAEYIAVHQDALVPVPPNVSSEDAAVAADAGITAYHAVHTNGQVKKGDKVLIIGVGGLGFLAVQIAKHFGAEVYALDIRPSSRELAISVGAKQAFSHLEIEAAFAKGFTVDTVIDFVSTNSSFSKGLAAIQNNIFLSNFSKGGRYVIVGVSDETLGANVLQSLITESALISSLYGTREDLEAFLELVSKGSVRTLIQKEPLDQVNRILNELRANLVLSRKVVIPPGNLPWV